MSPKDEALANEEFVVHHTNSNLRDDGYDVCWEVDTKRATYRGQPLCELGSVGKRKFENLVRLQKRTRIKFIYV